MQKSINIEAGRGTGRILAPKRVLGGVWGGLEAILEAKNIPSLDSRWAQGVVQIAQASMSWSINSLMPLGIVIFGFSSIDRNNIFFWLKFWWEINNMILILKYMFRLGVVVKPRRHGTGPQTTCIPTFYLKITWTKLLVSRRYMEFTRHRISTKN